MKNPFLHESLTAKQLPAGLLGRRRFLGILSAAGLALQLGIPSFGAEEPAPLRIATFSCDITPSLGQPLIGCDPIETIEQPLLAKGLVLDDGARRYVLCAFDWCQASNSAHQMLRETIAAAAGSDVSRVAVQCVHQHNAPFVDMDAQKLLAAVGAEKLHISVKEWNAVNARLAEAVKRCLDHFQPVDRIGAGQAKVERVASSRRVPDEKGVIVPRMSRPKGDRIKLQALPEGFIDPYLKTITFARGDKPLVRLHYYATHPQTFYRDGRATSDFPGDARELLEKTENVFQIYFTGCGGDITVGKYNDGSKKSRDAFAERLLAGMKAAVAATAFSPIGPLRWRTYSMPLTYRSEPGHCEADYRKTLENSQTPDGVRMYNGACSLAAWQRREQPFELSSLEIGKVHLLHLPGEPMVAFQFYAQGLKPNAFVAVAGYGDGAPGYICPAAAYREGGYEPTDSLVTPASEKALKKAIDALLRMSP
ncbi:MAG: hypothetical protein IT426_03765 [Pirellulales bacterium]|nr:hypothetical protein [Pirellulales bacterium]